jgi:tripartite-type tricarboxylate transporter receptor subunit TctC
MTFRCIAYALAASLLGAPGATVAQSAWPSKTVRIVVPVTTGGPSDLVARILADKLAPALGRPVIIDNRPGASQTVGAAAVAKSDPDGYTLLQAAANAKPSAPEEFGQFLQSEMNRWKGLVKKP